MKIDRDSTQTIINPAIGKHSATVILMHGLGDSADGWEDSAESLAKTMPHVKFILPTASEMPVTLNGGYKMNAWYDITSLSSDRAAENCEGIEKSCQRIRGIIESEIALGISNTRIGLAGFSQGGAMSIFCGLQLPAELKPAGLLVMSGKLRITMKSLCPILC